MFYRNTSNNQLKLIYEMPQNEPIHEDVGIVYIRITQPTGKHFNLTGEIGVCIDKPAKPLEQTVTMTNKIKDLIKNSN